MDKVNFEAAAQITSFESIPLTVIMGNPERWSMAINDRSLRKDFHMLINELHHDLLRLSTNSKLVSAPNSGHVVLQVNDAALIAREIRLVIP